MTYLIVSLLALAIGPILHRLSARISPGVALFDGFALVSICGIVLFEVLPGSWARAGWGVLFVFVGMYGPSLLESVRHRAARAVHDAALLLALLGLCTHGFVDGAALGTGTENLPVAILLHRVPVGWAIWVLLREEHGLWKTVGCLMLLGGMTCVGFFGGQALLDGANPVALGCFEALVAGSLLHVLLHYTTPVIHQPNRLTNLFGGIGAIAALVSLTAMLSGDHGHAHHHAPPSGHDHEKHGAEDPHTPHEDGHDHDSHAGHDHGEHAADTAGVTTGTDATDTFMSFGDRFLDLALETAPALLIAYIAAVLIFTLLPRAAVTWLSRGGATAQSLRGMVFGLPLPVCSCGVVPLYQSLTLRGVPVAAGVAFLIATPELGIDAVILSFQFYGLDFAIARVVAAGVVALVAGILAGTVLKKLIRQASGDALVESEKLDSVMQASPWSGLREILDSTGPWVITGLALAALFEPVLETIPIAELGAWQIPVFALLGMPVYVCASGATPLMAVFIASGVSPGAALAFLLTGPATNVTTFGVLRRLHGAAFAFWTGVSVCGLAMLSGLVVHFISADLEIRNLSEAHEHHGNLSYIALWIIAGVYGWSLFRRGPRPFIGEVLKAAAPGHGVPDSGSSCCSTPEPESCCTPAPPPPPPGGC